MKIPHIGDAELQVMQVLWKAEEPLSTAQINEAVKEYGWKRTTVSTFLVRLTEKGAVRTEKRGVQYYYRPLITQEAYRRAQTGALVHSLFDGSVTALAASLFEDLSLTPSDVEELQEILRRSAR